MTYSRSMNAYLTRLLALVVLIATLPAGAAQMVALDMKATGSVKPALAESLTPVLIAELSRRQGISVVSQADVRALLEHEARRQSLGCDDEKCMAEIAGSLGAELLLSSFLGQVGKKWVVTLNLIRVDQAKVIRRVQADVLGGEETIAEAVQNAVHNLFRDGLPDEVMGPASLSRLGFKAALLGFGRVVLDPAQKAKNHRRRIVLDLIHTELDYDVAPKFDALDITSRRAMASINKVAMVSTDLNDLNHFLIARAQWVALRQDMERVKEIRQRARERGVTPSGRPLRYEDPEPPEWPATEEIEALFKDLAPAQAVVRKALAAYKKRDQKKFASFWIKDKQQKAGRFMADQTDRDRRYHFTHDLIANHALTPEMLKRCFTQQKEGDLVVYLVQFRDGEPYSSKRVFLTQQAKQWKIRSW